MRKTLVQRTERTDEDFADEIAAHLELEADALMAEGMSRDEAMAAARRAFGNVTRSRERFFESNRRLWLEHLLRDLRYAVRQARNSPMPTLAIVLSLALGIGLSTAIFSLADQALVRALPVNDPDRLVQLKWSGGFPVDGMGNVGFGHVLPYPLFREIQQQNDQLGVFEGVFSRSLFEVNLRHGDHSESTMAEVVSGEYFPTLGLTPTLGRLLAPSDDQQIGGHPVVVLSHEVWRSRFGGDRDVVGTRLRLNNHPMTVIGVAPPGFGGMDWSLRPSIWVPMSMKEQVTPGWGGLDDRRTRFAHVNGRLAPDVDRQQAQAALEPLFAGYQQADIESHQWPQVSPSQLRDYLESALVVLPGGRGQIAMEASISRPLYILMAAAGLIFLLVCLNVANLSLARALQGRRALALHTALGADRRRLAGRQLTESLLMAVIGCGAGALLAMIAGRMILSLLAQPTSYNIGLSTDLDLRVLTFSIVIAGLTVLLAGVGPAIYAGSIKPIEALERQSNTSAGLGWRRALVIGQVALALILMIAAGLLSRTLLELRDQGPGFSTADLLLFRVTPTNDGYSSEESKPMIQELLSEIDGLPEVEHAGISSFELLRGSGWNNPVTIQSDVRTVTDLSLTMNAVSADFFAVLSTPIIAGRGFDSRDTNPEPGWNLRSAIVNEEFVSRYLRSDNAVGARLGIGSTPDVETDIEIVGVVQSFQDVSLRQPEPQVYFSILERSISDTTFYIRARTTSDLAIASIRETMAEAYPGLTMHSVRTIDDQLDRRLSSERLLSALANLFAVLATMLAVIGVYGVLAFSATRRTREVGIRIALGAAGWSAGGLIIREAAKLVAIGLVIALPISWAFGRLIESQLFGVGPMNPVIVVGAASLIIIVSLAAGVGPACRLGRTDPIIALRED